MQLKSVVRDRRKLGQLARIYKETHFEILEHSSRHGTIILDRKNLPKKKKGNLN